MVWENGPTKISYIMLTIEKTAILLPNSAISFRDRHLLIDIMLLFRLIWQKGISMMKVERAVRESDHQTISGRISDDIRTGLDLLEDF